MKPLTTLFLLLTLTTNAQIKRPFGSHGDSLYVWVTTDTLIKGHTLAPGYVFRDSVKANPVSLGFGSVISGTGKTYMGSNTIRITSPCIAEINRLKGIIEKQRKLLKKKK